MHMSVEPWPDPAPLPDEENAVSRRYLRLMLRWIPVAFEHFRPWPDRPACGHLFGGAFYYGLETSQPIATLALAAASPEYDPALSGRSVDEVRRLAYEGLRYLLYTHDTGPADCVRPASALCVESMAGTKWGERGAGFFKEGQAGQSIAAMIITASCLGDRLVDEDRQRLAAIAEDYVQRFEHMAPPSGTYVNTQLEENAWTGLSMTACLAALDTAQRWQARWAHARRWLLGAATMPQDAYDSRTLEGRRVRDLVDERFTLHPDGTVENHGIVHPQYMFCGIAFFVKTVNVLKMFGLPVPPHLRRHRDDLYAVLRTWCDDTGAPHFPQGNDWDCLYFYPGYACAHAGAGVYLADGDAATLERRALGTLERAAGAHGGRLVPPSHVRAFRNSQGSLLFRERFVYKLAHAYLAHRLGGAGPEPRDDAAFEQRHRGVHIYHHGGLLLHRHGRGRTSFAWRNGTMFLPATREGLRLIAPASGSFSGAVRVRGRTQWARVVAMRIRESRDSVALLLLEDLAEGGVRRELFLASLPDGRCLIVERLMALQALAIESVVQGRLGIMNDAWFGEHPHGGARRTVYREGGHTTCRGAPSDGLSRDVVTDLSGSSWVNVDDRFGFVFKGGGRAHYRNRHVFPDWRCCEDELVLGLHDGTTDVQGGEEIAQLGALWCPQQDHERTALETLQIEWLNPGLVVARVDGAVCACNFSDDVVVIDAPIDLPAGGFVRVSSGVRLGRGPGAEVRVGLEPLEPLVIESGGAQR